MEFKLTDNQQQIFDLVENSNENFCILGKPGVGKSVLINYLVANGRKTYTLAAPTGLAALNISGRTLHSLFMLPVSHGIIHPDFNNFSINENAERQIKHGLKHLIIDEVSMVRADMLDYIDRLLKHVKGNDKPFGGVQLILVGDFYQLAPVVIKEEKTQLSAYGYDSPFIFSSACFKNFHIVQLSEVLRQKGDNDFIKILDRARVGILDDFRLSQLNKRVLKADDLRIRLTGTNAQAMEINNSFLAGIKERPQIYTSVKYGDWPALPAEELISLKVGCQVMVKKNGADRPDNDRTPDFVSKVVNGTLGVVTTMEQERVQITLANGEQVWIYFKSWERKVKMQENGEWVEKVVASYRQLPLSLSWAISIHKSQGQSFDTVHIDANKIFVAGQLYVALSRCRSLAGLTLERPLKATNFWTDKQVSKFYSTI